MKKVIRHDGDNELYEIDTDEDEVIFVVPDNPRLNSPSSTLYLGRGGNLRYRVDGDSEDNVSVHIVTKEQVESTLLQYDAPADAFERNESSVESA